MKIVIFTIGAKEYGVEISQVRQVIRKGSVVSIPDAADFVEGIIGLHGKVIPLVNLRKKLGIEGALEGSWNRIIITHLEGHPIGAIVDKVVEVINLEPSAITAPDEVLKDAAYLVGVAKLGKRMVLIMDIEKVLSGEDKAKVSAIHQRVKIKKREGGISG